MSSDDGSNDDFKQMFVKILKSEWNDRLEMIYETLCGVIPEMINTGQYKKTIESSAGYDKEFMNYAKRYIEKRTDGMVKCTLSHGSTDKVISLIAELQNFDHIIEEL